MRSDEEIRADLDRLEELRAAFRKRVERARRRLAASHPPGSLTRAAEEWEEQQIRLRLSNDVPGLIEQRDRR